MTSIQRTNESGKANQPANDNDDPAPGLLDAVSLTNEENIVDLVRRTERVAILVALGMGGWLMLVPAIYLVLSTEPPNMNEQLRPL
ncbi:hypothetical protein FJ959_11990 [Mesorhizobium sp. B2-2-4]|nr:hypothetical protein FJ945_29980 [Mesorhizobium sp. B2-4-9]TPL32253.1 hypothetical protein FJ947_22500 [Mesorhizobium sp. B2-4-8]TPL61168.1 hypothetical protein FJ949_23860 [Mesorhizobium sp. B2-4-1]TPM57524.1 hypothetical protein FJ959_11990 [Mesorhizobium sp. B2-2-4]TPM65673.1 hypothetical protein FJ965_15845 [Mesorhizobium sp. B2-2-1]TPM98632.1 hypothetical protein FJ966_11385 [Mesorhizobium sp. B2-1-5]TPN38418.1 hypothetical protein FJ979_13775 [Mesorhizobium sp. B1-1-6]TPN71998.1 hyp